MRIALLFGALLGALQTVATLVIYACGLHSAPEMLAGARQFEHIAAFALLMACLSFGLNSARRARHVARETFTTKAGIRLSLVISSVGGLVNTLGQYLYLAFINPAYPGHFRAERIAALQATPEQMSAHPGQLDNVASPLSLALAQGLLTFLFGLFIGGVYSFLFRDRSSPAATGP